MEKPLRVVFDCDFGNTKEILMGIMTPEKVVEKLKSRFPEVKTVDYTITECKDRVIMVVTNIGEHKNQN